MKNFLRWLGIHIHDWGKWERRLWEEYIYEYGDDTREVAGQQRVCTTCGKTQWKRL